MTEIAVLFTAPAMMALVPKTSIANKVSKGMDTLMSTANYTITNNDVMRYDSLHFSKPGVEFEVLDLSMNNIFTMLFQYCQQVPMPDL
jgi:hypothetical protein